MTSMYRIKVKTQHYEIEVESSDKDFVVQKFEEHVKQFAERPAVMPAMKVSTKTELAGKDLSLQEFINQVAPSSGPEYVVTIGYFLEKYQQVPGFTSAQVKTEFQRAKFQHPNPTDALLKARGAGRVMEGPEKGTFVLTRTGEQWVENKLGTPSQQ